MGAFYFPLGDANILADSDRQEHAPRNFLPWPLRLFVPLPLGPSGLFALAVPRGGKMEAWSYELLTEEQSGTLLFR